MVAVSQSKLADHGASGQSSLVDVDEDEETCPNDRPKCPGPDGLVAGELCCFGCWLEATDEQLDRYEVQHGDY